MQTNSILSPATIFTPATLFGYNSATISATFIFWSQKCSNCSREVTLDNPISMRKVIFDPICFFLNIDFCENLQEYLCLKSVFNHRNNNEKS